MEKDNVKFLVRFDNGLYLGATRSAVKRYWKALFFDCPAKARQSAKQKMRAFRIKPLPSTEGIKSFDVVPVEVRLIK
jgi:hypothetical protein